MKGIHAVVYIVALGLQSDRRTVGIAVYHNTPILSPVSKALSKARASGMLLMRIGNCSTGSGGVGGVTGTSSTPFSDEQAHNITAQADMMICFSVEVSM